jgi:hypothetical protein
VIELFRVFSRFRGFVVAFSEARLQRDMCSHQRGQPDMRSHLPAITFLTPLIQQSHTESPTVDRRRVQPREERRTRRVALALPYQCAGAQPMLMFKRSQLYIGLALAALVQIFVVARFLMH